MGADLYHESRQRCPERLDACRRELTHMIEEYRKLFDACQALAKVCRQIERQDGNGTDLSPLLYTMGVRLSQLPDDIEAG